MSRRERSRGVAIAVAALLGAGTLLSMSGTSRATPLLAAKPGPIDRPLHLVAADFDRDGYDDLAIADFEAAVVRILINQRDGTFAPQADSPVSAGTASFFLPTSGPLRLAVADLNPDDVDGDGVPNALDNCPNVFNSKDNTGVQPVGSDTKFGVPCQQSGIDTDGDGIPDYDPVNHTLDNCPLAYNPLQEDDNNDGVGNACKFSPDLLILETGIGAGLGFIRVRVNDGSGGMLARGTKQTGVGPADLILADFNGDGVLDFVSSNSAADYLQLHTGLTDGTFTPQQVITAGDGPEGLAAADFNGDRPCDLTDPTNKNFCDLAVANRSANTVGLYLNSGSGLPSQASQTLATQSEPTTLLAGRLDADPYADLVVLDQGATGHGMIEVFRGSASGVMTAGGAPIDLGQGHRPKGGALHDLDGDGNLDLAVTDFTGGQVLLYRGAGNGTFSLAATLSGLINPVALALLDYDHNDPAGGTPDLAVLDFATNRVALYRNDGGFAFVEAPTSPVSQWVDRPSVAEPEASGMLIYGADASTGLDIALLHRSPPRLDVLSGLGTGFFRTLPSIPLSKPKSASGMLLANLRQDNFFDLLIMDEVGSQVTVVTGDPTGLPVERETLPIGAGPPLSAAAGTLLSPRNDHDRDGVLDVFDDCPTIYNPPGCKVGDPGCEFPPALCTDRSLQPTDCSKTDPLTGQCDSDGNGIGDQCQVLSAACTPVDTDLDAKSDYDPSAITFVSGLPDFDHDGVPNVLDNCPTVSNPPGISGQQADTDGNGVGDACQVFDINPSGVPVNRDTDGDHVPDYDLATGKLDNCPKVYNPGQEDNDGDGVGNACVLAAALDNCPWEGNPTQSDTGFIGTAAIPSGVAGNNVGDDCDEPVSDLAVVSPASGAVTLLAGDGSGAFRSAPIPQLSGLSNPSSALIGPFSLICSAGGGACTTRATGDVVIAERGTIGNFADDDLRLFRGDGTGSFTSAASVTAQGDPGALVEIDGQRVCSDPSGLAPGPHFDISQHTNMIVAVEPGTATLGIYLASGGGLIPPPAHAAALPVPAPLAGIAVADFNQDGIMDLVALSSGSGSPAIPNVTVYIGIGNGLFFTDPSLDPIGVKDGGSLIATGFINIKTDSTYPDVAVFNRGDATPTVLLNTLTDRADIDGSGRVDGFDLALLARAFGADRGEDFTIQADGTLLQTGASYDSRVVGNGFATLGQDLCKPDPKDPSVCRCSGTLDPLFGAYGLPVDINLDGKVDGTDLALLAMRFGLRP